MRISLPPGDWDRLGRQPANRTALQRSRFVHWKPAQHEAEHVHPVSDQLILVAEGTLELRTARQQLQLQGGQTAWVPRGCRHTLTAHASGCRFWEVIAPNREPHQLTRDFPAESGQLEAVVRELTTDGVRPSSRDVAVELVHLAPQTATSKQTLHEQERLWYVLSGSVFATVRHLSGDLAPHSIVHVPREYPHQLQNRGKEDCFVLALTLPKH